MALQVLQTGQGKDGRDGAEESRGPGNVLEASQMKEGEWMKRREPVTLRR